MDWWQETERQRVRPDQINNGITYVKCQRISPPVPLIHKKKENHQTPKDTEVSINAGKQSRTENIPMRSSRVASSQDWEPIQKLQSLVVTAYTCPPALLRCIHSQKSPFPSSGRTKHLRFSLSLLPGNNGLLLLRPPASSGEEGCSSSSSSETWLLMMPRALPPATRVFGNPLLRHFFAGGAHLIKCTSLDS